MKVVLVNPPSPPEFRVSRGLMGGFGMAVNPELLYPPIELAHVAAALLADGFEVTLHDADARGLDSAGALEAICAEGPDLVCLDSSSTSLDSDRQLGEAARRRLGVPVAMLGAQVSYAPDDLFAEGGIDCAVRGEPEHTVLELARRTARGEPRAGAAGLSWRDGDGRVVHEPEREKIADLDALPLPARQFLDNQAYRFPGITGPITTVKSSRGCPLDCSFCGYVLVQGRRFRFRSPASVLAELTDIVRVHDVHHVIFRDPIFTVRKDRVREICEGILERGLELEWQCETSVGTLDPPLLERMAAAGCKHVSLGLESGSAAIQKAHCSSKLLDLDRAEEVFRACRRLGIETRGFCMIGFPEETPEMVEETIRLAERMDPDQVQFCAVTAYPGTRLWQDLHGDHELDHADMTGHRGLEGNRHMSGEQIEARIREAYRRFYGRPKRMLRELRHPLRLAGRLARYVALLRRKG